MILAVILSTLVHAKTETSVGEYFHARAEAEFIQFLEEQGTSMQDVLNADEKSLCSGARMNEFSDRLNDNRERALKVLNDMKGGGTLWRQPATYGGQEKILMEPERATAYANERLRFARLEAFGRLSKLAPTCLDIFRREANGSRKVAIIPRFRVESAANIKPVLFCTVTMRYWKDIKQALPAACASSEE